MFVLVGLVVLGWADSPAGPLAAFAQVLDGGVWSRSFAHGATARWYVSAGKGTVQWPGQPVPPVPKPLPPSPPSPVPPQNVTANCGKILKDMTIAYDDVGVRRKCSSAQECCDFCTNTTGCVQWAWHGEAFECHAHGGDCSFRPQHGTYSGVLTHA